jgi:tetratricopeptide (TPR) repeat protein
MASKRIETWRRHAKHYVRVMVDLSVAYDEGRTKEAIAAFDAEWGQVEKARRRILSEPGVDQAGGLALGLYIPSYKLIRLRRGAQELVEDAEAVLPLAKRGGSAFYADIIFSVGTLYQQTSELQRARQLYTDGVAMVRANYADMDPEEAARSLAKGLAVLGEVENLLGDDEAAMRHYDEALTVARRAGREQEEGAILGNIAVLKAAGGDHHSAVAGYQRAIAVSKKYGDFGHVLSWTANLANALSGLQRYEEAESVAREALSLAREQGNRIEEGRCLTILADAMQELGNAELALEYGLTGYEILTEVGNSSSQGAALSGLGRIYADLGQFDQAVAAHEQAAERMNQAGRADLAARATASADELRSFTAIPAAAQAAEAKAEAGDATSALADLAELLHEAEASGHAELVSICLNHTGYVLMQLRRLADAQAALERAIELAPEGSELLRSEVGQLATVHRLAGDEDHAAALYLWVVEQGSADHADGRTTGLAAANLAAMAGSRGRSDVARSLYTDALAILRAAGAEEAEQVAVELAKLE